MSIPSHVQVVVVGAGAVGALVALNLHKQGKQVLLIESRQPCVAVPDARTLALSYASLQGLADAGIEFVEHDLNVIQTVHVSAQNQFGCTLLKQTDLSLPYLGAVIDYAKVINASDQALMNQNIAVLWETKVKALQTTQNLSVLTLENTTASYEITADYTILAEGGALTQNLPNLKRRVFDYQQSAVVASVTFEQKHQQCAFERFAVKGPLALLPYQSDKTCRLVWTRTPDDAQALKNGSIENFKAQLNDAFGARLGKIEHINNIAVFPLYLKQLNQVYSGRVICIGNAAQTMHPVAAQGLNLGLRDAMALVQVFATEQVDNTLGKKYAATRRVDAHSIVGFTHALVTLFDQEHTVLQQGRSVVLNMLNTLPWLRKKFTEHLVFGVK
ncbi:FAD-dependent monooxygenase [Neisseria sp. Ec49-e6-T10]|uniref:FAD-dependent monooxygenase n=1 Tax=Neisseria sp. Ec49-e6-T10 TaxID=3140744 RepID=UPI003EB7577A